jgi:hypothetical protein
MLFWLWEWLPLILRSTPCKYIKNNIFHFEKKSFPMNVRLLTLKRWLSILDFSSYHVLQHICILKFDKLSNTIQVFYWQFTWRLSNTIQQVFYWQFTWRFIQWLLLLNYNFIFQLYWSYSHRCKMLNFSINI